MAEAPNTRMIAFDEPLPDGIIKIVDTPVLWDLDSLQETSNIAYVIDEDNSLPLKPTYVPHRPVRFYEWIGIATSKLSSAIVTTLAATQFNVARLSSDNLPTGAFDAEAIVRSIAEQEAAVVSLSADLIVERAQVQARSLLAPSGAYLTWIEILQESMPDEE